METQERCHVGGGTPRLADKDFGKTIWEGLDYSTEAAGFQRFGDVANWIILRIARDHHLSLPRARIVAGLALQNGGQPHG